MSSPIFIVVFPHSGTSLLDQILDAHPQLQVVEGKRIFAPVEAALKNMAGSCPQANAQLAETDILACRPTTQWTAQQLVEAFSRVGGLHHRYGRIAA